MVRVGLMMGMSMLSMASCATSIEVEAQEVTVGCGLCRFQMPDARGCFWAVEIGGDHLAVVGPTPEDHESHGPDGMCVMDRRAVVAGRIKRGQFLASSFELLPTTGVDLDAAPPTHTH